MPRYQRKKKNGPLSTIKVVKPRAMNLIKRVRSIATSSQRTGKLHMAELLAILDFSVEDKTALNKARSHVTIAFKNKESGQFTNSGSKISISKIPGVTYLLMNIQLNLAPIVEGKIHLADEKLELTDIKGISGTVASLNQNIGKIIISPGKAEIYL